jgi:hypothetical protein
MHVNCPPFRANSAAWEDPIHVTDELDRWPVISPAVVAAKPREAFDIDQLGSTLDSFVRAVSNREVGQAYALFSARAQRQLPLEAFAGLMDENFPLFEGYAGMKLLDAEVDSTINTDIPPGKGLRAEGPVIYMSGHIGDFQAIFEMAGDQWHLHSMKIEVPPDKFGETLQPD